MFRRRFTTESRRIFLQRSKDLTFIGFCIKARKIIFGYNTLIESSKKKYLIFLCNSAAENTKKDVISYAKKNNIKLLMTQGILLEEIVYKVNCKTAAVIDKNLAAAVLENISNNFITIDGGII